MLKVKCDQVGVGEGGGGLFPGCNTPTDERQLVPPKWMGFFIAFFKYGSPFHYAFIEMGVFSEISFLEICSIQKTTPLPLLVGKFKHSNPRASK